MVCLVLLFWQSLLENQERDTLKAMAVRFRPFVQDLEAVWQLGDEKDTCWTRVLSRARATKVETLAVRALVDARLVGKLVKGKQVTAEHERYLASGGSMTLVEENLMKEIEDVIAYAAAHARPTLAQRRDGHLTAERLCPRKCDF